MEYDRAKLEWLEFDLFADHPHIAHGVFQRHGGVSIAPFASLNVSDRVGDHPDSVKVNRELIRKTIGADLLIFPYQEHGTHVLRVTQENAHQTHHADALFTTVPGIALCIAHADCQGVILFDPSHKAIAVAHVGWRGNVQNLLASVISTLKKEVGTNPRDLLVGISPSLGPDHAEFKNYKEEFPQELWSFQTNPHFFDLWGISVMQLTACGVSEQNIEVVRTCTACSTKDYFSYRMQRKTGRNATVVALKK